MSRFQASVFKNQLPAPAKREKWHSELSLSHSAHDASDAVAVGWYSLAPSGSKGRLNVLDFDKPAKHASNAPSFSACSGDILDLDTAFHDVLAVSSDDSKLSVFRLPPTVEEATPIQSSSALQLDTPATQLRFHPHASGLLCAVTGSTVTLCDTESTQITHTLQGPAKGLWSVAWASDGRELATTSKDGLVQLWDPRASSDARSTASGHQGVKASRIAWVGEQIFTTGFSKMREREYALRDPRNLEKPIRVQRLDTGTGVLMPLVDNERKIVYLAGRGDMALRWTELTGTSAVFSEGSAPLPVPILGAAFAPRELLDVMRAEINRIIVSSKEGVLFPVSIGVPRKQYLDFYPELFPPERREVPAQNAAAWLAGGDARVEMVPIDPTRRTGPPSAVSKVADLRAANGQPPFSETVAAVPPSSSAQSNGAVEQTPTRNGGTAEKPSPPIAAPFSSRPTVEATAPANGVHRVVPPASSPVSARTQAAKPWSRNFLTGKTPLKSDYDGLSGLAPSSASDTQSLRANTRFLVFPLSGAGGRLGVHAVERKGRLPTLIPAIVTGQAVNDFLLDPFDEQRLYVAGGDGHIRVFRIPQRGLQEGHDLTEAESIFGGDGMDRILELHCHPTAKDLVSTLSDDRGSTHFRVWNVQTRQAVLTIAIEGRGVFASAWSRNGSLVALACRDNKLRILDPRKGEIIAEIESHGSTRPSRPIWLDDDQHILTTGFNVASNRELRVYKLQDGALQRTASTTLDASPAPLMPYHDPDTGIVYLYSRGERSVRAYDISSLTALTLLPSFEHGTLQQAVAFLPKRCVDVRAVEVAVAYRLSPSAIQRVTWTIPRARAEFFQDDVYPPTRDIEKPALTADEWLAGRTLVQQSIDLQPADMTALSQAPVTAAVTSTRNKITGPVLTDSRKREQQLNRLFEMARKDTDESTEREARPGASAIAFANAPDDDDW